MSLIHRRAGPPRGIDSLPPLYQDLVQQHFGAVQQVDVGAIRTKLDSLAESGGHAADVLALRGLLSELLNPTPVVSPAASASMQDASSDPVVNPAQAGVRKKVAEFRSRIDKEVIGQPLFKGALERILEARLSRRVKGDKPLALVLGGPSGVGKTSGAEALARTLNDNPDVVPIVFDCTEITSSADLNRWKGSAQGYVGYGDGKEPVTPESIAKAGKIPVILVDEISRAGEGLDPRAKRALQHEIYNYFANYVDKGDYRLNNKTIDEFKGGVIVFTTNAGYDDPALDNMTVDQRRDHYMKSAMAEMPTQMAGRIGQANIIGMDELTAADLSQIADAKLKGTFTSVVQAVKGSEGFDFSFGGLTAPLKEFLGEAAATRRYGTRTLMRVLDDLLQPKLDTHNYVEDGEYVLDLDPRLTDLDRTKLVALFNAKEDIPGGLTSSNFPVVIKNQNARPVFSNYTGAVPHSNEGLLNVLGTGAVGGKSYVVLDKGDFSPIELHQVKPGGTVNGATIPDSYVSVPLPKALANTNYALQTADLDEDQSLFLSTSIPESGDTAETHAFIYNPRDAANPFTQVSPPPVALSGASMTALNGKVYLFGGRDLVKIGDEWTPAPEVELNNGVPMQPLAMEYSPDTDSWRVLDAAETAGLTPRANMASVAHDGKIFLIGGEEVTRGKPGTLPFTASSAAVQAYDPATGTVEDHPPLKAPVVGATALSRGDAIEVLGGKVVALNRHTGELEVQPQLAIQSLNTASGATAFKVRRDESVPPSAIAGDVRAMPAVAGHVVGPFFDSGSLTPTFYRYSVPPEV